MCLRMIFRTLLTRISGVLHSSRLDWAFAGTSSTILHDKPDGSSTIHTTWRHWIDSQARNAEEVSDEGDMNPQLDGTTLEKGHNIDPVTGARTDYEELWEDLQPTATEGDSKKVCAVLQLHDDKNEARGMVVRLGQLCQGLLRVGKHISLERWEWKAERGWKRQARIGSLWLPCGVLLEGQKLKLGGELQYEDYLWKIVELEEF